MPGLWSELTYQNHLQFGWGAKSFNFDDQESSLWAKFQRPEEPIGNFKEECLKAAQQIAEKHNNIFLAMSGGIDSEIVARCFLELGIPFVAFIIRFDADENSYDTRMGYKFCSERRVHYLSQKMNFHNLCKEALADNQFVTNNIYNFFQMKILSEIKNWGGVGVIGSGEPRIYEKDGRLVTDFGSKNTSIYHWKSITETECIPAFFLHTPGIIRAYFNEPIFEVLKNGSSLIGPLGHNIKKAIYEKYWVDLAPRNKYSGFEQFRAERHVFKLAKQKQWGQCLQEIQMTGDEL